MFGQYPTPRRGGGGGGGNNGSGSGNMTPRLPPISTSPSFYNNQQSAMALLDRTNTLQADMQAITDERRARQMLEEQVRVIIQVCKKLNQDIEALDAQMGEKNLLVRTLEMKSGDLQTNSIALNQELQFKMARHDSSLHQLENETGTMGSVLRDLQNRFNENTNRLSLRMNDIEGRINELNSKFDSILTEQNLVMKNVEGDTIKQLQLIDEKTRTMLNDVRSQIYQNKTMYETEMVKMESRLSTRIEESIRNNEKFDRLDRKVEEQTLTINKRFTSIEDDFQRNLNKLIISNENMEHKVKKLIEERLGKTSNDYERLKREMKTAFEEIQDSIVTLQNVVEGKIKLAEDRLEKEIEKIRQMVVLI